MGGLYHATFAKNVSSIMKGGILAKKQPNWADWTMAGYTYFEKTPDKAVQWMTRLWADELIVDGRVSHYDDIAVLAITQPPGTKIERDRPYRTAMKIKGPIPAKYIKLYKIYDKEPLLKRTKAGMRKPL